MRVVYVAGKFTGANSWEVRKNVNAAEALAFQVAELGAMPLCPHTNTANFFGTLDEAFWYAGTLELLRRCDAVIFVPGWEESKGVRAEFKEATARNIPMFSHISGLAHWLEQDALRAMDHEKKGR